MEWSSLRKLAKRNSLGLSASFLDDGTASNQAPASVCLSVCLSLSIHLIITCSPACSLSSHTMCRGHAETGRWRACSSVPKTFRGLRTMRLRNGILWPWWTRDQRMSTSHGAMCKRLCNKWLRNNGIQNTHGWPCAVWVWESTSSLSVWSTRYDLL